MATWMEMAAKDREIYEQLMIRLENKMLSYPAGHLRCFRKKGHVYYLRADEGKVTYIPKEQTRLIKMLAQKGYEEKLLKNLKARKSAIEVMERRFPKISLEEIYESLSPEKKSLVEPEILTDEQYVEAWMNRSYIGLGFKEDDTSRFYSDQKERMRSKSEVIIGNFLYHERIPYKYESPIIIKGRNYYPDFTILDVRRRKEWYLEHFGMMDDAEYVSRFIKKIDFYQEHGIYPGENLIMTFETRDRPLNTLRVKQIIEHYLN